MLNYKRAFSLIELLVVIAMVGILSMIAIPSYKTYRLQAQLRGSFNDLQTSLAYYATNNAILSRCPADTACTYGVTNLDLGINNGIRITFDPSVFPSTFTGVTSGSLCLVATYTKSSAGTLQTTYRSNISAANQAMLVKILQIDNSALILDTNSCGNASGSSSATGSTSFVARNGVAEICLSKGSNSKILSASGKDICNTCGVDGGLYCASGVCTGSSCRTDLCGYGGSVCLDGSTCSNNMCNSCGGGSGLRCPAGQFCRSFGYEGTVFFKTPKCLGDCGDGFGGTFCPYGYSCVSNGCIKNCGFQDGTFCPNSVPCINGACHVQCNAQNPRGACPLNKWCNKGLCATCRDGYINNNGSANATCTCVIPNFDPLRYGDGSLAEGVVRWSESIFVNYLLPIRISPYTNETIYGGGLSCSNSNDRDLTGGTRCMCVPPGRHYSCAIGGRGCWCDWCGRVVFGAIGLDCLLGCGQRDAAGGGSGQAT